MKKIKATLISLCAASFLLSAVPSFAQIQENPYETERVERIINYPNAQRISYGLYDVNLRHHLDPSEFITLAFFLRSNKAEFIILDIKGNEYGNVDIVYKKKGNGHPRITLDWIESMRFNDIYHKIIDKFYSKTDKKKPSGDWIKLLEKNLKKYYLEKEDMKKLEAILEKK